MNFVAFLFHLTLKLLRNNNNNNNNNKSNYLISNYTENVG